MKIAGIFSPLHVAACVVVCRGVRAKQEEEDPQVSWQIQLDWEYWQIK